MKYVYVICLKINRCLIGLSADDIVHKIADAFMNYCERACVVNLFRFECEISL